MPFLYHPTTASRRGRTPDRCRPSAPSFTMSPIASLGVLMSGFRSFPALLPIAIIACSTDPGIPTPGSSVDPFTLSLVGDEDLTLHPDEERTLHVLLAKEEEGPVASARV